MTWGKDDVGATEISPIRSQAGMVDPVLLWVRTVAGHESLRIGQCVRDVRVGPDGPIYVLTDEDGGRLWRLSPLSP